MAFQFNQGDRPLDGYTIQRGVGRGGFGEVYYALSDGGKEVALKYLRENPSVELRGVAHCLNLKSPYLVGLHDVKQNEHGDHFVIMEYVTGPSLRDLMNAEAAGLGAQKAAYFLREIAKGLAYLHDRGIVHRDLKPGNIFYEDGYVKIGDYGLAKLMATSQHSGQTMSVGTVHYMAPEVGSGNYDRTIDIYALGVMLYEMLLGRVPFAGATMGEVLMKHLTAQPEVDELPEPFPHVIRKALAKDPNDRYQTVQEMVSEIFSVASLDQSVASFEPGSLSTAAAKATAEMNLRRAADYPGAATLTGAGSSNVGRNTPPVAIHPARMGPPGRFERVHNRIGRGVGRVAGRIDNSALAQQLNQAGQAPGGHGARAVIAMILAIGISFGVSIITGKTPHKGLLAGVVFLNIASIVQGVLVGSWLSYEKLKVAGVWVPRLLIAAIAAVGLVATSEISSHLTTSQIAIAKSGKQVTQVISMVGSGTADWAGPLILCMIFGDWAGRLFDGRKGKMSLGSAFSIGLAGFIAGGIFLDGQAFKTGVIVAAASLVVQAIGSLWPLRPGAVVPKTRSDDSDEQQPTSDSPPDPMAVAVEPPGFGRGVARRSDSTPPPLPGTQSPGPAPATATLAADKTETDPRLRRSSAVRALWMMGSAIALVSGIILYATPNMMDSNIIFVRDKFGADRELGLFSIFGTAAMAVFLFMFTRSWSGYKRGLWRGVFRPAIFFGGAAVSACSGITMGMMHIDNEFLPLALAGVLLGAIGSLFVWFVPVAPYKPKFLDIEEDEMQKRAFRSQRLKRLAYGTFGSGCALIAFFAAVLSGGEAEDVIPPVAIMTMVASVTLWGFGHTARRPKKIKSEKKAKLALPLRRVFEIDPNASLPRLIERHMSVFGYKLVSKGELLWSFERGTWPAQFYSSDIRQWKVKFNVAAYELDTGGYRITCFLDMDASFNEPVQKQLHALNEEIGDLCGLLSGREVPSGGPVVGVA
ncbi:hypothetical protein B7486_03985 [cyanobacterium TDX16]|nr:hypothetical protein B7486_03985 [cyanobacterium TDX16]